VSGGLVMTEKEKFHYEIQYTKAADKFLKDHEDVREQYEEAVKELLAGIHPEKVNVKRIKGKRNDYFRIRLGNYRVVYAIINGKIIVINTLLAGSRGDVYKKMSGLK
jgi:mRNA interferase RelE/StbE